MTKNTTLIEFLLFLSNCSGDDAIDLINKFQSGEISIAGFSVNDV